MRVERGWAPGESLPQRATLPIGEPGGEPTDPRVRLLGRIAATRDDGRRSDDDQRADGDASVPV